ncbi:hypothetical protein SY83_17815 [Paenibacillus swuensis]|uniref:ChrA protein n=1 Tax=Paenibacillus swuensis TaxID=1178515 RepID=A0A172TLC7_9BACL|nr:chromate efflux transporter [Paenibacillus swuensis]ANE47841.1 hypothetical protein SY83_17815 [Paenibacillus swuensis]
MKTNRTKTSGDVFWTALKLGCTSFGGPTAHLGYFREEYVIRKQWLKEKEYADLVALCQFLPGPASSQVGMAIGMKRAGLWGGFLAWLGFTLPSALLLFVFATLLSTYSWSSAGWLQGLKIVAVAVVAQAVWGMAKSLTPDRSRQSIALMAAVMILIIPQAWMQLAVLSCSGLAGWFLYKQVPTNERVDVHLENDSTIYSVGQKVTWSCGIIFIGLLIVLPIAAVIYPSLWLQTAAAFYRIGALVFGGGHVVLPLLQEVTVDQGWILDETFLAGYAAAQAVPGPLFTFAGFIGASMSDFSILSAAGFSATALMFIFAPSFLLVAACLPYWDRLRTQPHVQKVLAGVNAGVVGLLLAALYDPIWTGTMHTPVHISIGMVLFGLLTFWKAPPWLVVLLGASGGALLFG